MPLTTTDLALAKASEINKSQASMIEILQRTLVSKDEALLLLEKQVKELSTQLDYLKRQLFGRKSERLDPNQMLFDGLLIEAIEQNPVPAPEEKEQEVVVETHIRKRKSGGRNLFPDHLERVYETVEVSDKLKFLPDGTKRPLIGYEESERLAITPQKVYVKVLRRPKYGSPVGAEENGVVTAPLPERLIPRCAADETLLAHLAISKYEDHLPLYRLERILKRAKVNISRQTMCRWIKESGLALELLASEIRDRLFATGMVHFDDTPVDLLQDNLKKPRGKRISQARFWVACSSPRDGPWTTFDFAEDRSADAIIEFFKDYGGKYTCDAYREHEKLLPLLDDKQRDETRMYGCWAHTRRYFFNAHKSDAPRVGAEFIALIKNLYMVEREIAEASDEVRLQRRHKSSKPTLQQIRAKINELLPGTPPKSNLGKALAYTDKYWKRLCRFVHDPQAGIDNNPVENAIRPIALGRKNWLFIGDKEAGRAAANLMTIIATCKKAGDDPYEYLVDVMQRMPLLKTSEIGELIPEHWGAKQNGEVESKTESA